MISFRAIKLCGYILLSFFIFMAFIPCVGNDFLNWDDHIFVVRNPHIASLSVKSASWMLTTFFQGAWHPLTWFSHGLDLAIWGINPSYHHLMNVMIHVLNVVLVCMLFVKLQEGSAIPVERMYIAAFTGALLFGVHPLRVESVAWLAERKDVLCSLFFLLTLICYLDYARASSPHTRLKYYLLGIITLGLALLSKAMAVTAPVVFLVLDYFPLKRLNVSSLRLIIVEKIPFLILALGAVAMNLIAAGESTVPLSYVPAHVRIMNAFYAVMVYLKQSVFPTNLMPLYQLDRDMDYFGAKFVFSAIAVSAATAACLWRAVKGDRLWAAVWSYYLITLGPVLGLFMSFRHSMADRYTYVTTLGFWLLVGLGVGRLWEWAARVGHPAAIRSAVAGCVVMAALGYGFRTHEQIGVWKNSEILWNYIIDNAEHVPAVAYYGAGKELEKKGELDKALAHYQTALSLNPGNYGFLSEIANVISKKGDREKALEIFKEICASEPTNAQAHYNVGRISALLERYDEAIPALEMALRLAPENGGSLLMLAFVHLKKGDKATAIEYYGKYTSAGYPQRPEFEEELGIDSGEGKKQRPK